MNQKSNEIIAIPELLDALLLKGSIITIDAMWCQKKIAKKIINEDADYILALKDNQKELHQNLKDSFRFQKTVDEYMDTDFGHGRIENRKCTLISDLSDFGMYMKYLIQKQ